MSQENDQPPIPASKRALAVVLMSVLIDMIGVGIIIPVLPEMIRAIAGSDMSQASVVGGWLFVAYSAMQFLCGPAIGNLSDAYGRRPVLLASILGLGVDYLVTAFAPSIGWLFVGRIVAGICGASYTTANAYVTDITAPKDRAKAFGLIGAAFGVGFILGPALGGLLGQFGHQVPFLAAAVCSIANFMLGYFALPESLAPERRRPFRWRRASPFGMVRAFHRQPVLMRWSAVLLLFFLAQTVYVAVWAFAAIERYGWGEVQIGISLALLGVSSAIVQGLLVGPAIRWLGEWTIAFLSLLIAFLSALGYTVATQGWAIYALILIGAFQGMSLPAINALMSHEVPPEEQGALQGAVASLQGIASIFGPLIMTQTFSYFTGPNAPWKFSGAPFALATCLFGFSTVLMLFTSRNTPGRKAGQPASSKHDLAA